MQSHVTPNSPEAVFAMLNAYQQTEALKAALELDIFTAIAEGASKPPEIAKRCNASERGVRILCDFLVIHRLLTKSHGQYALSETAAMFLDRRSPVYVGTVARFLGSPMLTDNFKDLAGAVRKGGTVQGSRGTLEPEHPVWVDFARGMVPLMMPAAEQIADLLQADKGERWKVLDIAAGHGMFGITLALRNPNAEITAQDWKATLAVAQENAAKAGVQGRFRTLPGSAFDVEFGADYDIALITNFLHHFDAKTCESLLAKLHRALKPGGRAVTLEFVPNEDRVSPPIPAAFSLVMLGSTPSGDAYTFPELNGMLQRAGFARTEAHALQLVPQTALISYKAH
jgi:ubiquinone/menaquinone biosynthesis C-methylase UbiE